MVNISLLGSRRSHQAAWGRYSGRWADL